jgi:hypothetical protein
MLDRKEDPRQVGSLHLEQQWFLIFRSPRHIAVSVIADFTEAEPAVPVGFEVRG